MQSHIDPIRESLEKELSAIDRRIKIAITMGLWIKDEGFKKLMKKRAEVKLKLGGIE